MKTHPDSIWVDGSDPAAARKHGSSKDMGINACAEVVVDVVTNEVDKHAVEFIDWHSCEYMLTRLKAPFEGVKLSVQVTRVEHDKVEALLERLRVGFREAMVLEGYVGL